MHPLFSGVSKQEMEKLLAECEQKTFEKDDTILGKNERRKGLVLLLDGVAEVYVEHEGYDEVLEVVQKGGLIGFSSLADFLGASKGGKEELVAVRAAERCDVLVIPFSVLARLWDDPNVHDYLLAQACVRLKDVYVSLAEQIKQARKFGDSSSFVVPVQDLMIRDVVTLPPTATVQEAAKKMAETHISSIIVTEEKKLCGIVTETDLVERVLSCSLPYDTAIERVMTKEVATISRFAYYYDALAMMIERGVKHLPVVDDEKVQGIVTFSDLIRHMQKQYGQLLQQVLEEVDRTLAEQRDKKRYALKDKRTIRPQTLFGEVEVKRNYYFDREKKVYTSLLDVFLQFEGAHGVSPLLKIGSSSMEMVPHGSQRVENISGTEGTFSSIGSMWRERLVNCSEVMQNIGRFEKNSRHGMKRVCGENPQVPSVR